MKVTAIDDQNNLFLVEDFYPLEVIDQINQMDFFKYDYEPVLVHGQYTRRNLKIDDFLRILSKLSDNAIFEVVKQSGINLHLTGCGFWLDTEGYWMDKHIDSIDHVSAGMQIYIRDSVDDLGTCFYNTDNSVRYQFPYKANTGYFMINTKEQIHAMPYVVSKGISRLSVYHWLTLK